MKKSRLAKSYITNEECPNELEVTKSVGFFHVYWDVQFLFNVWRCALPNDGDDISKNNLKQFVWDNYKDKIKAEVKELEYNKQTIEQVRQDRGY